jgi:hypothetical protein
MLNRERENWQFKADAVFGVSPELAIGYVAVIYFVSKGTGDLSRWRWCRDNSVLGKG